MGLTKETRVDEILVWVGCNVCLRWELIDNTELKDKSRAEVKALHFKCVFCVRSELTKSAEKDLQKVLSSMTSQIEGLELLVVKLKQDLGQLSESSSQPCNPPGADESLVEIQRCTDEHDIELSKLCIKTTKLETDIASLGSQLIAKTEAIPEILVKVQGLTNAQESVEQALTTLKLSVDEGSSFKQDQAVIAQMISDTVSESLKEEKVAVSKRNNVIVFGLEEAEIDPVRDLLAQLSFQDLEIDLLTFFRLGTTPTEPPGKPRPFKIIFPDAKNRSKFTRNFRLFRELNPDSPVAWAPDTTIKQREIYNRAREELRQRVASGETGLAIRNGTVVQLPLVNNSKDNDDNTLPKHYGPNSQGHVFRDASRDHRSEMGPGSGPIDHGVRKAGEGFYRGHGSVQGGVYRPEPTWSRERPLQNTSYWHHSPSSRQNPAPHPGLHPEPLMQNAYLLPASYSRDYPPLPQQPARPFWPEQPRAYYPGNSGLHQAQQVAYQAQQTAYSHGPQF